MSASSSSSPHQLTPKHPPERARVTSSPSTSLESHSSDYTSRPRRKYDIPKLLKAVAAFRLRNGVSPTAAKFLPYFLNDVKDFVPKDMTVKQLLYKLCSLREKFRKTPIPGPNCSDIDREFYELGLKAWVPGRFIANESANGSDEMMNTIKGSEESENEDAHGETEESGEDEFGNDCPYQHLKRALEDFWISKNLDLNVLHLALLMVDPIQAKHLDEQLMEIAKDELKLKFQKNKLSNAIIEALCTGMKR